jgi:hypothetical protein
MLYICIFSNEFDLNQATSVSHSLKPPFIRHLATQPNDTEHNNPAIMLNVASHV